MKPRKAPMKRTPLKSGKPLERNTPMPRTGIARKPAKAKPNGPVKARSESTHIPDPIREAVLERDNHACTRCGVAVRRPYYSLHHRRPRGMGGSRLLHTMANLVTLCGSGVDGCHGAIERDRPGSRATGWLVPNGAAPEGWPVLRGGSWWQPGDEWTAAAPHPRQFELLEAL